MLAPSSNREIGHNFAFTEKIRKNTNPIAMNAKDKYRYIDFLHER